MTAISRKRITIEGHLPRPRTGLWMTHALVPASVVVVILVWQALVWAFNVPAYLVPTPLAVLRSLLVMVATGTLAANALLTLTEAAGGFVIAFFAAMLLAVCIAESRLFERLIYPYLAALQSVPKVAIAPLVMIWFGMGLESKVVLSALLAFFPMLVSAVEGLKATDAKRTMLFKSLGATRLQTLRLLKIPHALPLLLVGVELGTVYAMLGAIVAEFVGSSSGLGAYLMAMNYQMDAAGSFALLFILAIYGLAMQYALRAIRKRVMFW